jgi:hypothetical protein
MKTAEPPTDTALQVAENNKRGRCETRYPPDAEKLKLAVRR